ncbi:hypothetical protein EYF80_060018 [Liparis tanakae]|uniref:Uncharacterized protein n=1 Tax=Liparis tanakae TaxID=230148 RepID=A0A4Z2EMY6_9TELE|nr:hypothetical protein EYF80_060018 [Liparis tanakae]
MHLDRVDLDTIGSDGG